MKRSSFLDRLHAAARRNRWLGWLAGLTRGLLALGFLPSGWTKLAGYRFTRLGVDTEVGFFFEALYRSGFYYRFLGLAQLLAALLILLPRTRTVGAVMYFAIIVNIYLITLSMAFAGTTYVTGLMLLGAVFLLCWDYDRVVCLVRGPVSPLRPAP
jgi:uncharacterized membrane protein YphA (DoxX/SURF4 family)